MVWGVFLFLLILSMSCFLFFGGGGGGGEGGVGVWAWGRRLSDPKKSPHKNRTPRTPNGSGQALVASGISRV